MRVKFTTPCHQMFLKLQSSTNDNHGQMSWDTLVFSYTEAHKRNKTPHCPSPPPPLPTQTMLTPSSQNAPCRFNIGCGRWGGESVCKQNRLPVTINLKLYHKICPFSPHTCNTNLKTVCFSVIKPYFIYATLCYKPCAKCCNVTTFKHTSELFCSRWSPSRQTLQDPITLMWR